MSVSAPPPADIGFALHTSTEGFGIVGPLGEVRPTWRWLLACSFAAGIITGFVVDSGGR